MNLISAQEQDNPAHQDYIFKYKIYHCSHENQTHFPKKLTHLSRFFTVTIVKANARGKKRQGAFSLTKGWCAFSLTNKSRAFSLTRETQIGGGVIFQQLYSKP